MPSIVFSCGVSLLLSDGWRQLTELEVTNVDMQGGFGGVMRACAYGPGFGKGLSWRVMGVLIEG